MRKVTMIDPPTGWKYGFPRPLTLPPWQSLQDWLIEHDYPQREIDVFGIDGLRCRRWVVDAPEPKPFRPNAHDIVERSVLIMTRRHVAMIRLDSSVIARARTENERDLERGVVFSGSLGWRLLLERGADEIIEYMLQRSPIGQVLRSTSPFVRILPADALEIRREMWRQAKAELIMEHDAKG